MDFPIKSGMHPNGFKNGRNLVVDMPNGNRFHKGSHPNYTKRVQELIKEKSQVLMGKEYTDLSDLEAIGLLNKNGGIIDLINKEMDEAYDALIDNALNWTMDRYFKCCKRDKCICPINN